MRKATVIRAFLRGNEEVRPGQVFECDENEFQKWRALGFIAGYETKVDAAKKKPIVKPPPSASLPAGQASKKKTAKRSKKLRAKSSS